MPKKIMLKYGVLSQKLSIFIQWKRKIETAPFAGCAFYPKSAAVGFGKFPA